MRLCSKFLLCSFIIFEDLHLFLLYFCQRPLVMAEHDSSGMTIISLCSLLMVKDVVNTFTNKKCEQNVSYLG